MRAIKCDNCGKLVDVTKVDPNYINIDYGGGFGHERESCSIECTIKLLQKEIKELEDLEKELAKRKLEKSNKKVDKND